MMIHAVVPHPDLIPLTARPPTPFLPPTIGAAIGAADVVADAGIGKELAGLQSAAQTMLDVASAVLVPALAPDVMTPQGAVAAGLYDPTTMRPWTNLHGMPSKRQLLAQNTSDDPANFMGGLVGG